MSDTLAVEMIDGIQVRMLTNGNQLPRRLWSPRPMTVSDAVKAFRREQGVEPVVYKIGTHKAAQYFVAWPEEAGR